jgi:hypothetical protein
MSCTPNPEGMKRVPLGGKPAHSYEIKDHDQVVGVTERRNESRDRYWLATPVTDVMPKWFAEGRHQEGAMAWLRDPS